MLIKGAYIDPKLIRNFLVRVLYFFCVMHRLFVETGNLYVYSYCVTNISEGIELSYVRFNIVPSMYLHTDSFFKYVSYIFVSFFFVNKNHDFDLILYVLSLCRDMSSWVEPVLS